MLVVAPFFKGTTINKNKRLDHELLRSPETDILKYHEYSIAKNHFKIYEKKSVITKTVENSKFYKNKE